MTSRGGGASAAGAAAGRKRQATLGDGITLPVEQTIKQAIQAFQDVDDGAIRGGIASVGTSGTGVSTLVEHLADVYKSLNNQGFQVHHIERCLAAIPLNEITVNTALDWLLFLLDRSELPAVYANQTQSFADIEVKLNASVHTAAAADGVSDIRHEGEVDTTAAAVLAAQEEAERARKTREQHERDARENAARRAWILQYAEGESSSDDDRGDGDRDAPSATDAGSSDIEDWEVWGDPREVERRKAGRARAALPRDDRLSLIAAELARAKGGASHAKTAGDKTGQQTFGQIIGQLKREMAELGVNESQLPAVKAEAATAANRAQAGIGAGTACTARQIDTTDTSATSKSSNDASGNDSDDQGALGFDVFDGAVDVLESVPESTGAARKRAKALAAAAIQPWGTTQSLKSSKNNAKRKDPTSKTAQVMLPKAVLQQVCVRSGWAAPRYERRPPGGERDRDDNADGGEYRYSVSVDFGARKATKKSGNFRSGRSTFLLPTPDDGWARIEDAQNAVATLALVTLCHEESPHMWAQLPPPFNELWLAWLEEGVACASAAGEESDREADLRYQFARDLVAQHQHQGAPVASGGGGGGGGGVGGYRRQGIGNSIGITRADALKQDLQSRNADPRLLASENAASQRLLTKVTAFRSSAEGREWEEARGRLPAASLRRPLEEALASTDVVVISGETGSGKTTQIPQFLLDMEIEAGRGGQCSVICTQPRRIAAISVADRVASERGDPPPGKAGGCVGYAVRLDSATTSDTRLLFCTTGILLRRLAGDPCLASVTHVVVDEVHERTLQGDFIIALLRELVTTRREAGHPLKVILMSATLDSGLIAAYFGGCPVLHAPGRTFPVEHVFLEDVYEMTRYVLATDAPAAVRAGRRRAENQMKNATKSRHVALARAGWGDDEADQVLNPHYDGALYQDYSAGTRRALARVDEERIDYDCIEELVGFIHKTEGPGAILIFLPGMAEISNVLRRLESSRRFQGCWVVPLHSTVSPADQRKAFRVPPQGARKIVVATNIAETSLTIDDVVFVVDSGRLKERRHDPQRSMSLLVETWVSVASAKQRRGRAGRVQKGVCYSLYTRDRFENRFKAYQTPEMGRVPLEELVLQVHLLQLSTSAAEFAARVLQPPPVKAVDGALRVLREVGALSTDEELTPLGRLLAQLPVDVRVGKLLVFAAILGCLSPALSIAACLSHKSPFQSSGVGGDGADRDRSALCAPSSGTIAAGQQSDHLILAAAVDGWLAARNSVAGSGGRKAAADFARRYGLGEQTLDLLADMRAQFASMLGDVGLLTSASKKRNWYDEPQAPHNRYSRHPSVIKAALAAALYPNVAVMDDADTGPLGKPRWHDGTGAVMIHPTSSCASLDAARFHRPFLTYLEKMRTSQVYLRDCTVVSPAALLLFGGVLDIDHGGSRVTIDGWLRLKAPARIAVLVKKLRHAFEAVLQHKVASSHQGGGDECVGTVQASSTKVIDALAALLQAEAAALCWSR